MGLPITEYPLSEIYVHSLKEKVEFRPFLVKEEKLLVLAAESGEAEDMVKASQQIVTNCSFGKVEGDKIPIFDMQNIFIELNLPEKKEKDLQSKSGYTPAILQITYFIFHQPKLLVARTSTSSPAL